MTQAETALHAADADATEALGARLAAACGPTVRIYLSGDLGTGKTTLVRGFLRARGHSGPVKSPTFTLIEPYEALHPPVYHFDLYRLDHPEELDYLGAEDYLCAPAHCLVEWPEQGADLLPRPDLRVRLDHREDGRRVVLRSETAEGSALVARMQLR